MKAMSRWTGFVALMVAVLGVAHAADQGAGFQVTAAEIPLRDGTTLPADIYLPDSEGQFAAVLIMTPYGRARHSEGLMRTRADDPTVGFFGGLDYAVVVADWREGFNAQDRPLPSADSPHGRDGHDAVEWIAGQPWCTGRVGMYGGSALGRVQFMTAEQKPPHLAAIMPLVSDFANPYQKYYHGGVLRKAWMDQYQAIGWGGVLAEPIMAHPLDDGFYEDKLNGDPAQIAVPTLLIGGWFDLHDMPLVYTEYLARANAKIRKHHRVIVGPWTHGGTTRDIPQGELSFPGSPAHSRHEQKRFFDHWLRGLDNGEESAPRVSYYVMGTNEWRTAETWPPPGAEDTGFFLHGGGGLSVEPPEQAAQAVFRFDPGNPVPTVGGANLNRSLIRGPADQREQVESHPDVLIYTTEALDHDVAIAGNVKALLFVSSDAVDTDVAIRLVDVHPDGRSMLLADGIRRLSLRQSFKEHEYLKPGAIYEVEVRTPAVANTFLAGHRIRLIVAASNSPRYDLNTHARDAEVKPRKVTNTLFHDTDHPSALILPVAAGLSQDSTSVPRESVDLEYPSSDRRLVPAALSMPEGEGPFPVVVTIHGGQGDREQTFIRTLAAPGDISETVDMLNEQPWAVLSVGYRGGAILGMEEDDVVAGIRFAKTLDRIDPDRVGVIGGSHGGHLALRAAEVMGEEISCVAAGSPWMTNPDVLLFGDPAEPPLSEISAPALEFVLDTRARLLGGLERSGKMTIEELKALIAQRSIEANAANIQVPALFLLSRSDVQVPHLLVEPTVDRMEAAGRDVTVYLADDSLHGFYWGRDIDGGARAGLGPKTPTELEEEAAARSHILEFFQRCFGEDGRSR
jgi:predicted acyl esterase